MILARSYRATGRPDLELGKPPRGGACSVGEHLLHDIPNVYARLAEGLDAIAEAGKSVGYELRRFGLNQMAGMSCRKNTRGDEVHRMDEFAHRVLRDACEACEACDAVSSVSSEESEEPEEFARASAVYDTYFDPADGSSNLDVCAPVGTIFAAYDSRSRRGRTGRHQMLAGT